MLGLFFFVVFYLFNFVGFMLLGCCCFLFVCLFVCFCLGFFVVVFWFVAAAVVLVNGIFSMTPCFDVITNMDKTF